MWKEHKANAASIESTLGGTNNHMFLILSPARYNLISPTPFVYPAHPGQLNIHQRTMAHQTTVLIKEHKEQLWFVKKATKQMIMEAIPHIWLQPILNIDTSTFDRTMWGVMKWLLDTCDKVMLSMLREQEDSIKHLNWSPQ
uniref:Uncharacterized protein n=1 Tax=Corethron hystrix TaxID=216773 RepID=A0A7S1BMW4_9STRA|mmetsp:Transcript_32856/g.75604  ORF Transcript_32856/g.75604 Transcript_32856/m.75604 type:complete len:141 (+) Transcript_32856:157-579(+)